MPRNAVAHLGTLADCALLGLHCFHCTAQCAHCVRGYRRCSPWTHSCRSRRSALPCLRFHRTSTSPKHKIPAKSRFRRDFVEKSSTKVEHGKAVGQSAPPKPVLRPGFRRYTLAIVPPNRWAYLAYSANLKAFFRFSQSRAVGGSCQTDEGENFPFQPLNGCLAAI